MPPLHPHSCRPDGWRLIQLVLKNTLPKRGDLPQDWLSQSNHNFPYLHTYVVTKLDGNIIIIYNGFQTIIFLQSNTTSNCFSFRDGILYDFKPKISRRPVDRECPGRTIEVSIANQLPGKNHPKQRKFKACHLDLMRHSATSSSKSQNDVYRFTRFCTAGSTFFSRIASGFRAKCRNSKAITSLESKRTHNPFQTKKCLTSVSQNSHLMGQSVLATCHWDFGMLIPEKWILWMFVWWCLYIYIFFI